MTNNAYNKTNKGGFMNNQNQTPFGLFPQFGGNQQCQCQNQMRNFNERLDNLERQIRRLDRRITTIENNIRPIPPRPIPISNNLQDDYNNNYMI